MVFSASVKTHRAGPSQALSYKLLGMSKEKKDFRLQIADFKAPDIG